MKTRHRKQRTVSPGSVEERERGDVHVQSDNMRPEGRAGRGCEMRWGNSTAVE